MALELALIRPLSTGIARAFNPTTDTLEFSLADYAGSIGIGGTSATTLTLGRVGLTSASLVGIAINIDATNNSYFKTTYASGLVANLASSDTPGSAGGWTLSASGTHASTAFTVTVSAGNSGAGSGVVSIQSKTSINIGTSVLGAGYDASINIGTSHTSSNRTITVGETTSSTTNIYGNLIGITSTTHLNCHTTSGDINIDSGNDVNIECGAGYDINILAASDSSSDIIFEAHGSLSIPFNDAVDIDLSGSFTSSSIIGALNELRSLVSGTGFVGTGYTHAGLSLGDLVYVSSDDTVSLADSTTGYAAHGIISDVISPTVCTVAYGSEVTVGGWSLTAGTTYYLGALGALVTAPPGSATIQQEVGFARNTTTLVFRPTLVTGV
jgi:hypothetical protein